MRRFCVLHTLLLLFSAAHVSAQETAEAVGANGLQRLGHAVRYGVEMQTSYSSGQTPLWLNANKHGLSSLDEFNGYTRVAVERPLSADTTRRWGVGYGLDMAAAVNYTSDVVVQQAYVEGRWLKGVLSIGSKNWPMELKNNALSSGSQTLGINARPVPQVRIALPDYYTLPFGRGWLHLKGHIAYGHMTDENWQHSFTDRQSKYADGVYYHSKAGYIKIGNEERFAPLSLELGLEMAAHFGGTCYIRSSETGLMTPMPGQGGIRGAWNAFIPAGSDAGETIYQNIAGNQVGSWLMRINYETDMWTLRLYADKYFEDHSGMFLLDYDGYGKADEWDKHKKWRFLLYDLKDIMLGTELNLHYGSWLRNIVFEYIYTKYQSGPIYHDHTYSFSDHVGGRDNFYNHYLYTGWQHWGQVMGNPLYRSPIYNTDGTIEVKDSRFVALHLGFDGQPNDKLGYRVLATWQQGFGTYSNPYTKPHHNVSLMAECTYRFPHKWTIKGAYGIDSGHILGHNRGFQITITKSGFIRK